MKATATIRLVDRKTRTVAVYGPPPPAGKRPRLSVEVSGIAGPREVGAFCFKQDGRVATFIVGSGPIEEELLTTLGKYPHAPARPVSSYGLDGWLLRG